MESTEEKYLKEHSTPAGEALGWLERQTYIRTNYPRMLSGAVQGRFLTLMAEFLKARNILEIGTFTGYSSICLAYGLGEDGHLDALEINDELEDLIREGWERAGVSGKISLHIGDAKDTLLKLREEGRKYDLVYIDANKREYCDYYRLVMDMLEEGGCILADDVLWDGKLYQDPIPSDKQTRGIAEFNDMVVADPRVEVVILPMRDGLSIIRKKNNL